MFGIILALVGYDKFAFYTIRGADDQDIKLRVMECDDNMVDGTFEIKSQLAIFWYSAYTWWFVLLDVADQTTNK